MKKLEHIHVLIEEVLSSVPKNDAGHLLDVTAGGGGHFFSILKSHKNWRGECWDQDPLAHERISKQSREQKISNSWSFKSQRFGDGPANANIKFDYILADIGISSFQIDDIARGMSLFSSQKIDFRMNPTVGLDFWTWIKQKTQNELEEILEIYGDEPKAKKLAEYLFKLKVDPNLSAAEFAVHLKRVLSYGSASRTHPATRAFQALRIAINDEIGELKKLLTWAPNFLNPGGRLAIISFHSTEDRLVKKAFQDLADDQGFVILTKKPLVPTAAEEGRNPRSRSAKLRVLEKKG